MIIVKTLYELRSSGVRLHEKFANTLRQFWVSAHVWLTLTFGCAMQAIFTGTLKNPGELMGALRGPSHNYKMIGGDEPTYHLGGDFYRDLGHALLGS